MYTFPQEQDILYTPVELSRGRWSLGFLKICSTFLEGLKTVWILYLFSILPIWSIVPFIYGRMAKIFLLVSSCDGCVGVHCLTGVFAILFIFFLSYPFFCKACFRRLSSVCKCSLSEMVKALYTSELIADCFYAGWWCDSACKYLSVCVSFLYTWWPRVACQLF